MTTYYTKDQAEMILREWGIGEKLPRRGMQVGVQWAGGKQPNHCTITVAESKSTYGNKSSLVKDSSLRHRTRTPHDIFDPPLFLMYWSRSLGWPIPPRAIS